MSRMICVFGLIQPLSEIRDSTDKQSGIVDNHLDQPVSGVAT